MLHMDVLDVAIGLVFLYLTLSLVCSALSEIIESWLKVRAKMLKQGIQELLGDKTGKGLSKLFYEHPIIFPLFKGEYNNDSAGNLPSYISSMSFAQAVLGLLATGGEADAASADQGKLSTLVDSVGKDEKSLADCFDSTMDRISGWYKRRLQWIILLLGFFLACLMNADSIQIAKMLYKQEAMRTVIVDAAGSYLRNHPVTPTASGNSSETTKPPELDPLIKYVDSIGFPLGWENQLWPAQKPLESKGGVKQEAPWYEWTVWVLIKLSGILLTAVAVSFGAPFWFDLLNKFVTLRSTLKPKEKNAAK